MGYLNWQICILYINLRTNYHSLSRSLIKAWVIARCRAGGSYHYGWLWGWVRIPLLLTYRLVVRLLVRACLLLGGRASCGALPMNIIIFVNIRIQSKYCNLKVYGYIATGGASWLWNIVLHCAGPVVHVFRIGSKQQRQYSNFSTATTVLRSNGRGLQISY